MKSWWLLTVCASLNLAICLIYLFIADQATPLTFHPWKPAVLAAGLLILATGASTLAAGVWSSGKVHSWLLALNGLAACALGLIFTFWRGPLAFRTVALLIAIMAASLGIYELLSARTLRRLHLRYVWFFGVTGALSLGFALAFLAFVFRWIKLDPASPGDSLHWLGIYFGFNAVTMEPLARRLNWLRTSQSAPPQDLPALGNPKPAH